MDRAITARPDLFVAYYLPMSESTSRTEQFVQVAAALLKRLTARFA